MNARSQISTVLFLFATACTIAKSDPLEPAPGEREVMPYSAQENTITTPPTERSAVDAGNADAALDADTDAGSATDAGFDAPADADAGAAKAFTLPGSGGMFGGSYLKLPTANGEVALNITCNYGPPGDNEAYFSAESSSIVDGSVTIDVAVDGENAFTCTSLAWGSGGGCRAFPAPYHQGTWPWHAGFTVTQGSNVTHWDVTMTGASGADCNATVIATGAAGKGVVYQP